MACSICGKSERRKPKGCDSCFQLACEDCMERVQVQSGPYVGKNVVFTERMGAFRLNRLCKNCKAELALTEAE